jgi:hypothetical protein
LIIAETVAPIPLLIPDLAMTYIAPPTIPGELATAELVPRRIETVIGSITDKVLRASRLPLLLYRPTAADVARREKEETVAEAQV